MTPVLAALGALVVLAVLGTALLARDRSRLRADLRSAQAETAQLRERLDALTATLERLAPPVTEQDAYLITDAGSGSEPAVPDRLVLSATLGEPLLRTVALGHGLRRALSAEARHRIWFEMRREVRRARKQRRREMKEAWRRSRANGATTPGDAAAAADAA